MSNTTTSLTIEISDTSTTTEIATQYGCRFPDGSLEWVTYKSPAGWSASYQVAADPNHRNYDGGKEWRGILERRAEMANVDPTEYINDHTLIRRQVVVAVTGAEDVRA